MNVCLLFEQSGTFKKCFQKLGHIATDFDISNKYNETDVQMDLFDSIEHNTIDFVNNYDLVIAFFPCTWFSKQNDLIYNRKLPCFRKWNKNKIDEYLHQRMQDYERAKKCLLRLIKICKKPLIIENPASRRIIEILGEPDYYVKDRTKHGDILRKPTYFYTFDVSISDLEIIPTIRGKDVNHISQIKRSEISETFAMNFVKHIIL